MNEYILQTRQLGKRYGKRWAVKNLNLEVLRGDVFGFLGPNGAGKSTTIRMILSLIKPTTGETELFGCSLKSRRSDALRRVGGIVEKPDFYLYLSAYKNLEIIGALTGGVERKRILEVLDLVGLTSRAADNVKAYSHGMKQRLGIAQALLSDPELVILDEPTNGLDPQGMKEVRDLIVHLSRERKKTIILSSHLLNEIELVANRMVIINNGELVIQGDVSTLLDEGEKYVVIQAQPQKKVESVLRRLKKIIGAYDVQQEMFKVRMDFADIPELNKSLVQAGVRVQALIPKRSLEDLFLSMTEQSNKVDT
ncbi:MAG: ATP-binding cassette domain-containing protein [Ignavibacteriales bacterium]|nr:ATP-binding cassette domain-containing protein [Ignavibacteriales bacterium]